MGRHCPSPATGELAMGATGNGADRWAGACTGAGAGAGADDDGDPEWPAGGMAPFCGFPPTGGGWCEYHWASIQVTTEAAPCPRAHSARRADTDVPRPGALRAEPSDHHTGVRATTTRRSTLVSLCRR